MLTSCVNTKAEIKEPIIKELDHFEGRELFEIKDEHKVYFYGVANLVPGDKPTSIIISGQKDSFGEPAYIKIIHDSELFIVDMFIVSSYGSEINKIYLKKITDFNYSQLIIEYCAGAVGTRGWTGKSKLIIVSWMGGRFKSIFQHDIFIENHYTYDTSVIQYTYEFISKDNVKTILLKDQDGIEKEYIWEKGEFKER